MSGNNPYPVGLNFGGAAAQRMRRQLGEVAKANARREPCPHCGVPILPENMPRHLQLCGDAA